VISIHGRRDFEGLICKVRISDANRYVAKIEPHIGDIPIVRELKRLLEAAQRHVVLTGVETA